MRLIGSVFLIIACSGLGFLLSHRLSLRVSQLSSAIRYIEKLIEQMRLGYELPQILARLDGEVYIKDGRWHGLDSLKSQEINTLNSFLSSLGSTDLLGQQHNADTHLATLSNYLKEARLMKTERSRLYLSLGVLGGLFLAVLFI